MIRVVIADDHELMREGMGKLIEKQDDLTLTGEAESAEETMKLLRENSVDVVVLDIGYGHGGAGHPRGEHRPAGLLE